MTTVEEFLNANASYASTFQKGDLPMPPARKVAVLTCMDARIDPARALGLEEGMHMLSAMRVGEPPMHFAHWSSPSNCLEPPVL